MRRLAIALTALVLLVALACSLWAKPVAAASEDELPLTVEYTLRYRITLPWQGQYYPGSTSIRVEMYEIPTQNDHQTVQATLDDGSIQTINGKDTWVIVTTNITSPNIYTGTFVVTVDLGNTPVIPHQPLTLVNGADVDPYLLPDQYVTMSADVVSQAQQLVSETEDDTPKIIAKFVDWIQKNISYDDARWAERLAGADFPDLTDSQTLSARAGVCTDFSNLFMGFCRAVGIPARSVLGYGLRSSEQNLNQDIAAATSHAWAEVWMPDYGWLTVDPTWGDMGDVRKIAANRTRDWSYRYWYYESPSGSGIVDGTTSYSVTLTGWNVISSVTPVTLMKDDSGATLNFNFTNISPMPFLDNIAVKKDLLQNNEWSDWFDVSSELVFLNPGETYTYTADKEVGVGYWVSSAKAGDGLSDWQYPGGATTLTDPYETTTFTNPYETTTPSGTIPSELMDFLPYIMVAIILVAVVGAISSTRKRRAAAPRRAPSPQVESAAEPAPEPEPEPAPARVLAICPKCRERVPADSKFCTECGADLKPRKRKA